MLGRGETVGVFQVESGGMRKALVDMRADRFEDLIALVALYRPGPMANIPTYCARKLGQEKPDYIHALIEPVLKRDLWRHHLSGTGDADRADAVGLFARRSRHAAPRDGQEDQEGDGRAARPLRRRRGRARPRPAPRRTRSSISSPNSPITDSTRATPAAYALIAYWTGWFKANHPAEFLAASMTLDKGNTDKLAEFRTEAQRLGIKVIAPSVNEFLVDFDVRAEAGRPSIHYALSAVKGVGEAQAEALVDARRSRAFASLGDMAARLDPRAVNKKALESLAAAGAFDCLEPNRAAAFAGVESMLAIANREVMQKAAGQNALFGETEAAPLRARAAQWPELERLRREFDAIGFFLSGHPLEVYDAALKRLRATRWAEFARSVRNGASTGRLGASVLDRFERRTRNGGKIGIVQLSDPSGTYEAILFQEGLNQFRDLLEKGSDVLVTLQAAVEGEDVRARIVHVERLTVAAAKVQKGLRVFVRDETPLELDRAALDRAGRRGSVAGRHPRGPGRRSRNPSARPLFRERGDRRRAESRARRGGGGAGLKPAPRRWGLHPRTRDQRRKSPAQPDPGRLRRPPRFAIDARRAREDASPGGGRWGIVQR